jgi:hypothetical protein
VSSKIQLNPNYANGPAVDMYLVVTTAGTVLRQGVVTADATDPAALANVRNTDPESNAYASVVRSVSDPEIVYLLQQIRLELRVLRAAMTDIDLVDLDLDEGE